MKLTHSRAVLLMILVALMWSIAGVLTRQLEAARSFEITFWRSFFTAVSLLVILPFFQGRAVFSKIRDGGAALWVSGVCWSVMFTAFMVALTLTTVANVLITLALGPFMTAVAWMYGGQVDFQSQLRGMLVALLVPMAGAINWTVVQSSRSHGKNIDLVPAVLVGAVISSVVTLPLSFPMQATMHDIGLLAVLGLFQLAIPCVLSVWCASILKAPEISLLALLEVIFGILLAWVGAGEIPGPSVLTGGALVVGALVVNELIGWRQRA